MRSLLAATLLPLLLAACSGAGPAAPPGPAALAPAASPAASTTPPPFDRQGNANYDSSGNYIGPHGVGQMVGPDDNPDRNPGLSGMPSAADFPAGACTSTPLGTQCSSSETSSSSSSATCVTVDGTTRCN